MIKKLIFIAVIVIAIGLVASGMALAGFPLVETAAATDTVGTPGTAIPHGGFRPVPTASDACLQCHDIHEASADYVLLRYQTVADTCGSCHYLYNTDPGVNITNASNPVLGGYDSKTGGSGDFTTAKISPTYNPGYGTTDTPYNPAAGSPYDTTTTAEEASLFGTTISPTSPSGSLGSEWSAYEVNLADAGTVAGHQLQRGDKIGGWDFNDGTTNTQDYIPGGSNKLMAIAKDDLLGSMGTTNTMTFTATDGLFCTSCHTPHGEFGKLMRPTGVDVDSVRISRKLLSAQPNHSFTSPTVSITSWTTEGGKKWCGRCHDNRVSGGAVHTHPDQVCLNGCHGAPGDAAPHKNVSNMDFPHTSPNTNLLEKDPDALCLGCHESGMLP